MGTPTYTPQNDPHDTLIILNMHKWGKKFFKKICPSTRAPINQGPTRRPGRGQKFFCAFQPFLNSPQNSEYFEYRHIGSNKKISPCRMPKTKSPAPPAPTKPIVLYNHFGVCRGGGGYPTPPLWGRVLTRIGPRGCTTLKTWMLGRRCHGRAQHWSRSHHGHNAGAHAVVVLRATPRSTPQPPSRRQGM